MKNNKSFWNLLSSSFAAFLCSVLFSSAQASASGEASAAGIEFKISGLFDAVGELDANPYFSGNKLAGLLGTAYSSSFTVGTDSSSTKYMEIGPDGNAAWLFKSNYMNGLSNAGFSYSNRPTVVTAITNNFYFDGSTGSLPAGIYDNVEITGWLYDSRSGHIFGEQPGVPGFNVEQNFELIGTSDMLSDQTTFPFGNLDLRKVLYGQYYLTLYYDGVPVGRIEQDPPLHFDNGVLSGPGMSVSIASVPEPSMFSFLVFGLLVVFFLKSSKPEPASRTPMGVPFC